MLDKVILILTMAKTPAAKSLGKPPLGDKTLGLDPSIRLYDIEDGDETEDRE